MSTAEPNTLPWPWPDRLVDLEGRLDTALRRRESLGRRSARYRRLLRQERLRTTVLRGELAAALAEVQALRAWHRLVDHGGPPR